MASRPAPPYTEGQTYTNDSDEPLIYKDGAWGPYFPEEQVNVLTGQLRQSAGFARNIRAQNHAELNSRIVGRELYAENDWTDISTNWKGTPNEFVRTPASGSDPAYITQQYVQSSGTQSRLYKNINLPKNSDISRARFVAEVYMPADGAQQSDSFFCTVGWSSDEDPAGYANTVAVGFKENGDICRLPGNPNVSTRVYGAEGGGHWYLISGYIDKDRIDFGIRRRDEYDFVATSIGEHRDIRIERSSVAGLSGKDIKSFVIAFRDTRGTAGARVGRVWYSSTLQAPGNSELREVGSSPVIVTDGSNIGAPTGDPEFASIFIPRDYSAEKGSDLMIWCHGTSGNALRFANGKPERQFVADASDAGMIVLAPQFYGTAGNSVSWGDAGAMDAMREWIAWIRDRFAINNIYLVGASHGGYLALNSIHRGAITGVSGVYMMYPALSAVSLILDDNRYGNRFGDLYNIPNPATEAQILSLTEGYDPATADPGLFAGIPMRILHSNGDTVINSPGNTLALEERLKPFTAEFSVDARTGNHGDPSMVDLADFLAFRARTQLF